MIGEMRDISMFGKCVVMVLLKNHSLKSYVGEVDENMMILWKRVVDIPGGHGWCPSISLNSKNYVA